ncbi:MAG: hypothetical protein LBK13_10570 [Spirochaetales bacterium]|nr:hypothetical protein [Spirochaetales bacterium]
MTRRYRYTCAARRKALKRTVIKASLLFNASNCDINDFDSKWHERLLYQVM